MGWERVICSTNGGKARTTPRTPDRRCPIHAIIPAAEDFQMPVLPCDWRAPDLGCVSLRDRDLTLISFMTQRNICRCPKSPVPCLGGFRGPDRVRQLIFKDTLRVMEQVPEESGPGSFTWHESLPDFQEAHEADPVALLVTPWKLEFLGLQLGPWRHKSLCNPHSTQSNSLAPTPPDPGPNSKVPQY